MNGYVIIRLTDGERPVGKRKYAARAPIAGHSYVAQLEDAEVYPTRSAAEANCCENERVVDLAGVLGRAS